MAAGIRRGGVEPVVLVHGGAGRIAEPLREGSREGVRAAAARAQRILLDGGPCEEAAVAAVRELEDRPEFNAGRGSVPHAGGGHEMDAAVMRSRDLASGAVAAVPDLLDAVAVARRVLTDSPHCLLVGDGAARFARTHGVGVFGRASASAAPDGCSDTAPGPSRAEGTRRLLSGRGVGRGTRVHIRFPPVVALAALVAILVAAAGCSSRMPVLSPDPRSPEEYAEDRDACVRKHSFGVAPGPCLHCELFVLCMEKRTWRMDGPLPAGVPPCCSGTAERTS